MPFKDPQRRRQYEREYYARHREDRLAYYRAYRKANPEKTYAARRKHYLANIESIKTKRREYYALHRDRLLAYMRVWRAKRREKLARST